MCPASRAAAVGLLALGAATSWAGAQVTGYESLSAWEDLPLEKTGVTAGLVCSWDRTGGNLDYNWYEWPEGWQDSAVQSDPSIPTRVVTLPGPGVVTRFHMPHAAADEAFTVRWIVDGSVALDADSDGVLDGSVLGTVYGDPGGRSPLVETRVGGQVSYEPIAFQDSLVIESNNYGPGPWARTHHYCQYDYHRLPAGTAVTPFSSTPTPGQEARRGAAGRTGHRAAV